MTLAPRGRTETKQAPTTASRPAAGRPGLDTRRRDRLGALLAHVDVRLDGERPWDIQVHDERLFRRVLAEGSLGLGEAYMDGWWDAERLDDLFARLSRLTEEQRPLPWSTKLLILKDRVMNRQSLSGAREVAERHYDLGNDVFEAMLDRRMTYSCGYWADATALDEAQEAKLELICRKLGLRPGQRVLDIGCGWGSFVGYAAEKHGVEAVGVTISTQQAELARERCRGLPVEIRLQDYRTLTGTFDRVVSVGMFEHVGSKNYRTFFEVARRCLADDGLFLLHTIGSNGRVGPTDPWTERYIFPNGSLPTVTQLGTAIEELFVVEDWHTFGADYDRTAMAWFANFEAAWKRLRPRYGDRFHRMWSYYLRGSAGAFRARKNNLWQIVLAKRGVSGGYRASRWGG
jgi:cyclopropane-fatty-acyl-phospholipid synthase